MAVPPIIDFRMSDLEEYAKKIIHQSKAVTGVQSKLSVQLERKKEHPSRITIVGMQGDYILKPPSTQFEELPQNEDLTMHLASLAGIQTAQHTLIRLLSGELAYLTKRFDRLKGEKKAVEDFCQLSENLTEHKYRGSIEMIGRISHKYTTNKGLESQRLFEIVLFYYLTGNADMHLKNFSLMENELGEYQFAPFYDLVNTQVAMPEDTEESALTINAKKKKLKIKDFDVLANSLKINEKSKIAIYQRFENILPTWFDFIDQSFLSQELIELYKKVVSERHVKLFQV
ncbi:MAG: HipA domain-containing protein [Flavobacteriales bacterium]|jgi:serine/threonine-protein kinase HipA